MDTETLTFYKQNAVPVAARYESVVSPVASLFPLAFRPGSRVLDIGCGSGRDLTALLKQGYDAHGIEPVPEMRQEALQAHPELVGRVSDSGLPKIAREACSVDGVLCSAVWMHLPEQQMFDAAYSIRQVLRQHGRLLVSVPQSSPASRDENGRLFTQVGPEQIQLLFERLGFQQIGRWDTQDTLGRDRQWATLLFELRVGSALRPIDQIEGILNRDKKVATYKLALFRALADIATQQPHIAHWLAGGEVGISVSAVADRWLSYYWSIIGSEKYYPQVQGEKPGCAKPVKFRRSLHELTEMFRRSGGMTGFSLAYASGSLHGDAKTLTDKVLREVGRTIIEGPVKYSGGALASGKVFRYQCKQIVMPADLWREFCLMGHWISDAVILRWAELSSRLGREQAVSVSEVTGLLLSVPDDVRETDQARVIYGASADRECVWTGKSLKDGFEVDHVIPYSLWRSNQLWNLLPTSNKANRDKSDRIPTTSLLLRRRDAIVHCWRLMKKEAQPRFQVEVGRFLGAVETDWEGQLFGRLRESAELTSLQRGVERWEP